MAALVPVSPYTTWKVPNAPGRRASSPRWGLSDAIESLTSTHPQAAQLYGYVGPFQSATLFGTGGLASFAFRWFVKGLMRQPVQKGIETTAQKTVLTYSSGLPVIIKLLTEHDAGLKKQILSYGGAMGLGYFVLSMAQGVQEEMVRRQETCIRATLLARLTSTFRKGIQVKLQDEGRLRTQAHEQLRAILKKAGLNPSAYLKTNDYLPSPSVTPRYYGDPIGLSRPMPETFRFGRDNAATGNEPLAMISSQNQNLGGFKAAVMLAGLATGLVLQGIWMLKGHPRTGAKSETNFFVRDMEALFLDKDKRPLLFTLGAGALAQTGKLAVQGYREIEVTRVNATTEADYQNWVALHLDPIYRSIAEETALADRLNRFAQSLPENRNNSRWVHESINVILDNIGRSSAPAYIQSPPLVNLTAARS